MVHIMMFEGDPLPVPCAPNAQWLQDVSGLCVLIGGVVLQWLILMDALMVLQEVGGCLAPGGANIGVCSKSPGSPGYSAMPVSGECSSADQRGECVGRTDQVELRPFELGYVSLLKC